MITVLNRFVNKMRAGVTNVTTIYASFTESADRLDVIIHKYETFVFDFINLLLAVNSYLCKWFD